MDGQVWRVNLKLHRGDGVYYAGQEICGVARVELENAMDIIGVELRLLGCEWVEWSERPGIGPSYQPVEQNSKTMHLDHTAVLWGTGRDVLNPQIEELSKGRHIFPFKCPLPSKLPCSFESPDGCIRYSAHVTIMTPCCQSKECKTQRPADATYFTLLNHLDLNTQEAATLPAKAEKELKITSRRLALPTRGLCGRDGLVSCSLTMSRTAFVPGEYLFAEAHIHNLTSSYKARKVRCNFNQILTYRTEKKHTRRTHRTICQSYGDDVKAGCHQTWAVSDLLIPTIPPSNLVHEALQQPRLIDVTYELQLDIDVRSQSMSIAIPIIVGTMPPLESCLTLWAHRNATAFKSKRRASPRPPASDVSCMCPEQQPCVDFCPKYRTYNVAPPGAGMLSFEMSPGERRRSYRLSLYPIDESCV